MIFCLPAPQAGFVADVVFFRSCSSVARQRNDRGWDRRARRATRKQEVRVSAAFMCLWKHWRNGFCVDWENSFIWGILRSVDTLSFCMLRSVCTDGLEVMFCPPWQRVSEGALSPDGTVLATASHDGYIKFWQMYIEAGQDKPRWVATD